MSLYTRLTNPQDTGGGFIEDPEGGLIELPETKIPIHAFTGMLSEFERGYIAGYQIVEAFDLTPEETTDAIGVRDLIAQATNKTLMLRIFKDCLYLAEGQYAYTTQPEMNARLQAALQDGV